MTRITIPDSVVSIGETAFRDCTGLTYATIGKNVATIGGSAFWKCTGLTSINIPASVTSIGNGAFAYCRGLASITIPDGVASLGRYTFEGCSSMTNITIPDSVTSIGEDAFYGCDSLTDVYYTGTESQYAQINVDYGNGEFTSASIHFIGCAHSYDNACDTTCNVCGEARTTSHNYKTVTTKATLSNNGSIDKKCSVCGKVASTTTIRYAKTFSLSATSYVYNGKVKTPTVTVKDSAGKTLKEGTDYTVTYASGRKNAGTYKVTVKMKGNYSGTKTLTFKILPKAAISTQPKTQKVEVGDTIKFTVKATGTGLKYQWQSSSNGKTWKNCSSSSAAKSTFSFTSKTSHNGNYYRCKVTDSAGNVVYTSTVRAYVLGVTTQPKTQKVEVGDTIKFTVKATGTGLKYQWQSSSNGKTWKNCSSSSAKKASFSFTAKTSHDGNYYRCKVTDSAGNTVYTSKVRAYVLGIEEQPVKKTVTKGKTAKFSVEATGHSLTYPWQYSTDGGKTWKNCSSSSAKKAIFSFTAKTSHTGYYYRCKITDSAKNVIYTSKVKLTVKK